jgi:hypothetical protein
MSQEDLVVENVLPLPIQIYLESNAALKGKVKKKRKKYKKKKKIWIHYIIEFDGFVT